MHSTFSATALISVQVDALQDADAVRGVCARPSSSTGYVFAKITQVEVGQIVMLSKYLKY